jgi:hypothetical protein
MLNPILENAMIVVRDVFQMKFGKARDVKALWSEGIELGKMAGNDANFRALTDLVGNSYTFVLESEYDNLASYEESMKETFSNDEWRQWYQKLTPLIESEKREIFTVVE